jgi:hypothetical protein
MLRSEWSLVATLVGCLGLASLALWDSQIPKQSNAPEQQQAQNKSSPPNKPVFRSPAKFAEPVEPSEYYQPCGQPGSEGNSDLCAQWSAANAAREAAKWAWWQLWLSGFGVIGLVITLWFNFRALGIAERSEIETKDALAIAQKNADAAENHVLIAQDTAKRQLRAYVVVTELKRTEINGRQTVCIAIHNTGQTPAHNFVVGSSLRYGAPISVSDEIEPLLQSEESKGTIGPGHPVSMTHDMVDFLRIEMLRPLRTKRTELRIVGAIRYTDIFEDRHECRFNYLFDPAKMEFFAGASGNFST